MDVMRINPAHINNFPNNISMFGAMRVLSGEGAPTETPDFVGQFYINTEIESKGCYIAINTDDVNGWEGIA